MLKRNLIANYLGQGWVALMGLAFIPLYIKYLGIEAYGLIGLFAMLLAWLALLDMGMTPTMSREMARFTGGARSPESIRDLLRSFEAVAAVMASLIAVTVWAASDWLASDWLRTENLSNAVVAQAFTIMGLVAALRFLEGVYRSSCIGLQRQVHFNLIISAMATLRGLGAVSILVWVSPTIQAFFIWQGMISLLTLGTLSTLTYRSLPSAVRNGKFSLTQLRSIRNFAGGMIGITFLSLLLTQADKILLSKLLSLSEYGYYTFAAVVAGALYLFVIPITQAWQPRLSQLCASGDAVALSKAYHQGAQLVSVLMGSAAIVLIFFSETLLQLWTQDAELAHRSAALLSLLALGNMLNSLMWMPYQVQLAHGWTSLAVRINIVAVTVIVPAILWVAPRYGAEGVAWVWIFLNAGYVLIGIHFMHRRILVREKSKWYIRDLIKPLLSAITACYLFHWIVPPTTTIIGQIVLLALASTLTLASAASAAPIIRQQLWNYILRFLSYK